MWAMWRRPRKNKHPLAHRGGGGGALRPPLRTQRGRCAYHPSNPRTCVCRKFWSARAGPVSRASSCHALVPERPRVRRLACARVQGARACNVISRRPITSPIHQRKATFPLQKESHRSCLNGRGFEVPLRSVVASKISWWQTPGVLLDARSCVGCPMWSLPEDAGRVARGKPQRSMCYAPCVFLCNWGWPAAYNKGGEVRARLLTTASIDGRDRPNTIRWAARPPWNHDGQATCKSTCFKQLLALQRPTRRATIEGSTRKWGKGGVHSCVCFGSSSNRASTSWLEQRPFTISPDHWRS